MARVRESAFVVVRVLQHGVPLDTHHHERTLPNPCHDALGFGVGVGVVRAPSSGSLYYAA